MLLAPMWGLSGSCSNGEYGGDCGGGVGSAEKHGGDHMVCGPGWIVEEGMSGGGSVGETVLQQRTLLGPAGACLGRARVTAQCRLQWEWGVGEGGRGAGTGAVRGASDGIEQEVGFAFPIAAMGV